MKYGVGLFSVLGVVVLSIVVIMYTDTMVDSLIGYKRPLRLVTL